MAEETVKNEETTEKNIYEDEVNAANEKRSGKGTRLKCSNTRGKGSIAIKYEYFDESKPETLPTSMEEFTTLTKIEEETVLVKLLISGYNDLKYTEASDPIAEYVNLEWDDARQLAFRSIVRSMTKNAAGTMSLEEVVEMIKPKFEVAFQKSKVTPEVVPA